MEKSAQTLALAYIVSCALMTLLEPTLNNADILKTPTIEAIAAVTSLTALLIPTQAGAELRWMSS